MVHISLRNILTITNGPNTNIDQAKIGSLYVLLYAKSGKRPTAEALPDRLGLCRVKHGLLIRRE